LSFTHVAPSILRTSIFIAPRDQRQKIEWGNERAKAAYFDFSAEVGRWHDKSKRKFELGMRATEHAERCATIVAASCFSPTVDVEDIGWGLKLSRVSNEAMDGGVAKYMKNYYEFPKFCEQLENYLRSRKGGFAPDWQLEKVFRNHSKHGHELERAEKQLQKERVIERAFPKGSRGPAAQGWRIVAKEEE
jgi:hypothetical protein